MTVSRIIALEISSYGSEHQNQPLTFGCCTVIGMTNLSEELTSESLEADDQGNFTLFKKTLGKKIIILIEELSHDTFKQLCLSLNEGLGTDYKALMTKCFPDIYSLVEATEIKKSRSPAEKLLRDLINRQITVERLLRGVEGIGNIKARKIITEGRVFCYASFKQSNERIFSNLGPANIEFENIYTDITKRGKTLNLPGDYQFSPRHSTGQPQENSRKSGIFNLYLRLGFQWTVIAYMRCPRQVITRKMTTSMKQPKASFILGKLSALWCQHLLIRTAKVTSLERSWEAHVDITGVITVEQKLVFEMLGRTTTSERKQKLEVDPPSSTTCDQRQILSEENFLKVAGVVVDSEQETVYGFLPRLIIAKCRLIEA
ncbi:hypothetical protein pdam_00019860, partial [Pocillopora damicornis]